MGIFVCYLYDGVFGLVGMTYFNTARDVQTNTSEMKKAAVQEIYDYGFKEPRISLVRII